eukprot:tig00021572_g22400.t1
MSLKMRKLRRAWHRLQPEVRLARLQAVSTSLPAGPLPQPRAPTAEWQYWHEALGAAINRLRREIPKEYKKLKTKKRAEYRDKTREWFKTDPGRYWQATMGKSTGIVPFETLVEEVPDHKRPQVLADAPSVRGRLKEYFEEYWGKRDPKIDQTLKEKRLWKHMYKTKTHLKYEGAMDAPRWAEYNEKRRTLKPTAPGDSNLQNSQIKSWPEESAPNELLYLIICDAVRLRRTPDSWNKATTVGISKIPTWDGKLTNVRPITLLEVGDKLMKGILADRLQDMLVKQGALKGRGIAKSREGIAERARLASDFCDMHDIEISAEKTRYVTRNSKSSPKYGPTMNAPEIGKEGKQIKRTMSENDPLKVLGVFMTVDLDSRPQIDYMKEKLRATAAVLRTKTVYEEESVYLVNTLVQGFLRYAVKMAKLSDADVDELERTWRSVVKHHAELSKSVPNDMMTSPAPYGLFNLRALQLEEQLTTLLAQLRDTNSLVGKVRMERLLALKEAMGTNLNPLEQTELARYLQKEHLMAHTIHVAGRAGYTIKTTHPDLAPAAPADTIQSHVPSRDYAKMAPHLMERGLLQVAQVRAPNGTHLLPWKTWEKARSRAWSEPEWYRLLRTHLCKEGGTELKQSLRAAATQSVFAKGHDIRPGTFALVANDIPGNEELALVMSTRMDSNGTQVARIAHYVPRDKNSQANTIWEKCDGTCCWAREADPADPEVRSMNFDPENCEYDERVKALFPLWGVRYERQTETDRDEERPPRVRLPPETEELNAWRTGGMEAVESDRESDMSEDPGGPPRPDDVDPPQVQAAGRSRYQLRARAAPAKEGKRVQKQSKRRRVQPTAKRERGTEENDTREQTAAAPEPEDPAEAGDEEEEAGPEALLGATIWQIYEMRKEAILEAGTEGMQTRIAEREGQEEYRIDSDGSTFDLGKAGKARAGVHCDNLSVVRNFATRVRYYRRKSARKDTRDSYEAEYRLWRAVMELRGAGRREDAGVEVVWVPGHDPNDEIHKEVDLRAKAAANMPLINPTTGEHMTYRADVLVPPESTGFELIHQGERVEIDPCRYIRMQHAPKQALELLSVKYWHRKLSGYRHKWRAHGVKALIDGLPLMPERLRDRPDLYEGKSEGECLRLPTAHARIQKAVDEEFLKLYDKKVVGAARRALDAAEEAKERAERSEGSEQAPNARARKRKAAHLEQPTKSVEQASLDLERVYEARPVAEKSLSARMRCYDFSRRYAHAPEAGNSYPGAWHDMQGEHKGWRSAHDLDHMRVLQGLLPNDMDRVLVDLGFAEAETIPVCRQLAETVLTEVHSEIWKPRSKTTSKHESRVWGITQGSKRAPKGNRAPTVGSEADPDAAGGHPEDAAGTPSAAEVGGATAMQEAENEDRPDSNPPDPTRNRKRKRELESHRIAARELDRIRGEGHCDHCQEYHAPGTACHETAVVETLAVRAFKNYLRYGDMGRLPKVS